MKLVKISGRYASMGKAHIIDADLEYTDGEIITQALIKAVVNRQSDRFGMNADLYEYKLTAFIVNTKSKRVMAGFRKGVDEQ